MSPEELRPDSGPPHAALERLLQLAGPRPTADAVRAAHVRQAVHAAWQDDLRARTRRRWIIAGTALAAAASVAIAIRVGDTREARPPAPITVARLIATSGSGLAAGTGAPVLEAGASVMAGAVLRSAVGARATLALEGGGELRVDESTVVRLAGARRLRLDSGSVYIDSGGASIVVETPLGTVRDIGTQFEVAWRPEGLRVRVRDGAIRYEGPAGIREIGAGGELRTAASGRIETAAVVPCGNHWGWITRAAPHFTLEGRTVRVFLDWVAREGGCRVRFADPALAARVSDKVVHPGPVEGLTTLEALDIVLPTVGLRHRIVGSEIVIEAASIPPRP